MLFDFGLETGRNFSLTDGSFVARNEFSPEARFLDVQDAIDHFAYALGTDF
jgi:hypothetical protein